MTTKTEAAHEVRKVLQSVKEYWADPGRIKLTEADTRAHFIDPLLRALGYHLIGDVQHEVFVPDAKQYLDYRLLVEGKARVEVEAKAIDFELSDAHGAQVVQYCSVLGDEWAVVTNGRQWRLYHAFVKGPLADKRVLSVDIAGWESDSEFDAVFDQLWLVSKESFSASDGPASWVASRQLDKVLRATLSDPASPEVRYIRKRLQDQGVGVTAERVAAWLKSQLAPVRPAAFEAGHSATPAGVEAQAGPGTGPVAPPAKEPQQGGARFWLIPAGRKHGMSAAEHLRLWLDKGFWGFWESTPGRRAVHAGDWVCFYAAKQNEIVAYARVAGAADTPVAADEWPEPNPPDQVTLKVPSATSRGCP